MCSSRSILLYKYREEEQYYKQIISEVQKEGAVAKAK
jgi:hypothetical protein